VLAKSKYPGGDKPRPYEHIGIGTFGFDLEILAGINPILIILCRGGVYPLPFFNCTGTSAFGGCFCTRLS
jgi:hypothetical protein